MGTAILIIEDNEQNLYLMRFLLQRNGYAVTEARDGLEGIRRASDTKPALILLDIQLPEMDGYTVASLLRQSPALRTTPIIAVTSYAMPGDRERALAAGVTGYMEKPINPDTFVDAIREYAKG